MKNFIRKNKTKLFLLMFTIILITLIYVCYVINYNSINAIKLANKTEKKAATSQTEVPQGYTGIYTAQDLAKINSNLSGKYILMNSIDMTGKYHTIIGQESGSAFTGVFDGNYHTISNMTISSDSQYVGMFGYISGGTVKNLELENINVEGTHNGNTGWPILAMGGLAGYTYGSIDSETIIENVHIRNNSVIRDTENSKRSYIGGLIGTVAGGTRINNCSTEGEITSEASEQRMAGGLIGTTAGGNVNIENCNSSARIVNNGSINITHIGGLIGAEDQNEGSSATMKDCYSTASIINETTTSVQGSLGGILGYTRNAIKMSKTYSETTIQSISKTGYISVGGLIGEVLGGNPEINECYSNSIIDVESESTVYAGGLIGNDSAPTNSSAYMKLSKSYSKGNITVNNNSNSYIGGLIGYGRGNYNDSTYINITDVYSKTNIEADLGTGIGNIGGICGYTDFVRITNAYAAGQIDIQSTNSSTSIGGIIGTKETSTTNGTHVSIVTNSYWAKDETGVENGECGGLGKNSQEMKWKGIYANWDFDEIWGLKNEGEEYPYLRFESTVGPKSVVGIEVTTLPTKTTYVQNKQTLNLDGGVLTVTYKDGTTENMSLTSDEITVTGFRNTIVGKKKITVKYAEQTTTFDVEIVARGLEGIEIKSNPTKLTYTQNSETLKLDGGELTLKYNDETTETLKMTTATGEITQGIQVQGFDNTTAGEKTITISYGGKTATFKVEVIARSLTGIEIKSNPTKLTYIQNSETLKLDGGELTLKYNDGTTETLKMTTAAGEITQGIQVQGFDNTTAGEKTITISYGGKTTTFKVEVIAKELTKIEVSKTPTKTSYIQNKEQLDLTGGEIKVTYSGNITEIISMKDENVTASKLDNTTLGNKEITLTYKGKTTKIIVNVIQEFSYVEGEDGGITITGTEESPYVVIPDNINGKPVTGIGDGAFKDREDLISVEIPDSVTNIAGDAFDGNEEITIITNTGSKGEEYAKDHEMNYELQDKTIASISVDKNPDKMIYTKEDTELDLTGGRILLTYTDGTTSTTNMRLKGMETTEFDNTKTGKQEIKLKYKGKETSFYVEIKGNSILLGDINKDGKVDSTDLLLMKRHIVAQSKKEWILTGENFEAGDMNGDGLINATDFLLIKRVIVKNNK